MKLHSIKGSVILKVDRYLEGKNLSEILDVLEDLYPKDNCEETAEEMPEENKPEDSAGKKVNTTAKQKPCFK